MTSNDLTLPGFFTINGTDIWELTSFCLHPTCTLKNLVTGEQASFGMGGLTAQEFKRIKMPTELNGESK